jgi:hypothetical protein
VRGLPQRVAQQPLGIVRDVSGERERREPGQRRNMGGISLEDLAEQILGSLSVIRDKRRSRRLDARPLRIALSGAILGRARVGVLLEVDEHVAVRKPRKAVVWVFRQHSTNVLTRRRGLTRGSIGAREIDARAHKVVGTLNDSPQRFDALRRLSLIEERRAEQPAAVQLVRTLGVEVAQQALRELDAAGQQRRVGLAQALLERGMRSRRVHAVPLRRRPESRDRELRAPAARQKPSLSCGRSVGATLGGKAQRICNQVVMSEAAQTSSRQLNARFDAIATKPRPRIRWFSKRMSRARTPLSVVGAVATVLGPTE